jgi:transcriptional regulator with XRE-family HTH domain
VPSKLTPAERVERLRRQHGSHDKLAKALGVRRQRIIGWEKGKGISERYAVALAALDGSQSDAFRPEKLPPQFRSMRRQVQRIDEDLKDARSVIAAIRAALEDAGIAVSKLQ